MTESVGLAVLGGDERQIAMARALSEMGHRVYVWGLGACGERIGNAQIFESWEKTLEHAGVVILPLPASGDGVHVHCPLAKPNVFLRLPALLDTMQGRILLGGRLSEAVCSIAEQKQIKWIDYYENEVLQLKNALPTAEGAIAIAMRELPVTISGVTAAVIGYGRIGKLLAEKLQALGAHVTVYARRREALTQAELHRHSTGRLVFQNGRTIPDELPQCIRVLFNTVPQQIMNAEMLRRIPSDCVLIDLASPPGGIDFRAAQTLGLRTVWGTSLPGKCAPESAGKIIAETVESILEEHEISSDTSERSEKR